MSFHTLTKKKVDEVFNFALAGHRSSLALQERKSLIP